MKVPDEVTQAAKMAEERSRFRPNREIVPGCLVWPRQEKTGAGTTNVTLWKDQGSSGITGKALWNQVGMVLARSIDPNKNVNESLGDQVLVVFGEQLGWNETRLFELADPSPTTGVE